MFPPWGFQAGGAVKGQLIYCSPPAVVGLVNPLIHEMGELQNGIGRSGIEAGPSLLHFHAARPMLYGREIHLTGMHREVEQFQSWMVIVDPTTNFATAGTTARRRDEMTRSAAPMKQKLMNNIADAQESWNLRLYVAGQTAKSMAAFANLKKICEEYLSGRYTIEVVDLLENPQLAQGDQILAIPTLVRKLPPPIRKMVGDLSQTERVLVGLDLRPAQTSVRK